MTLEEKERMMRESEQTQRMKTQGELVPERRSLASMSTSSTHSGSSSISPNPNVPLMTMTPTPVSNMSNPSSAFLKDLTSQLLDSTPSMSSTTSSFSSIPTSQTMPSLLRPSAPIMQPQPAAMPMRPAMHFSSTNNHVDLTSSLLNNINSLGGRTQPTASMPMNAMMPSMPTPFFNQTIPTTTPSTNSLFSPPPPPGSTVVKGTNGTMNMTRSKTAASELDDLFN